MLYPKRHSVHCCETWCDQLLTTAVIFELKLAVCVTCWAVSVSAVSVLCCECAMLCCECEEIMVHPQ